MQGGERVERSGTRGPEGVLLGAGLVRSMRPLWPALHQDSQRHGRHIERSTSADLAVFDLRPERVLLGNAEQGVLAHLPKVPGHQCVALGRRRLRARHGELAVLPHTSASGDRVRRRSAGALSRLHLVRAS